MMGHIEQIAARQALITEPDWPAWCRRLEQVLSQASGADDVAAFVADSASTRSRRLAPCHFGPAMPAKRPMRVCASTT